MNQPLFLWIPHGLKVGHVQRGVLSLWTTLLPCVWQWCYIARAMIVHFYRIFLVSFTNFFRKFSTIFSILEIKPCEFGSRIRDMGAEVGNICFLSPLVLSNWEDLAFSVFLYFLRKVCLIFNFWMIKCTIMFCLT